MLRIRQTAAADLPAVRALVRAAFGTAPGEEGDVVAELVDDLIASPDALPGFSLAAFDDDETPVGYVLFSRAYVGQAAVLLLAPLAIAPARQRQGVGTVLVRFALDRARDAGEDAVLVLGDPAYYSRFGFVAAAPRGIEAPRPVEPVEAWQVLELRPGSGAAMAGTARLSPVFDDDRYW